MVGAQQNPPDVFITFAVNEGSAAPKPSQFETALTAKESRPADRDPEGNWGEANNGAQLSVRFDRTVFHLGEPVLANVFLRNITNRPLSRGIPRGTGFDSALCRFIVTGPGDKPTTRVEQPSFRGFSGSVRNATLYPKAQWKSPVCLNDIFKMDEPGTYLVTGLAGAEDPTVEIRSRRVLIQIVAEQLAEKSEEVIAEQFHGLASFTNSAKAESPAPITGHPVSKGSSQPSARTSLSPAVSSASNPVSTPPLASVTQTTVATHFTPAKKFGAGIITAMLAVLLAILWRAARRKRAG
jgi:hypothetical protein